MKYKIEAKQKFGIDFGRSIYNLYLPKKQNNIFYIFADYAERHNKSITNFPHVDVVSESIWFGVLSIIFLFYI